MKLTYAIFSLFLISFLLGCNKEKYKPSYKIVAGKYDWKESSSLQSNGYSSESLYTYSPSVIGKNYGIRIKKNNKIFFYENGKLMNESKIIGYAPNESNYDNGVSLRTNLEGVDIYLYFKAGKITTQDWPYKNFSNTLISLKDLP